MAVAVVVLTLITEAALALPSTTGIHLDLRVDGGNHADKVAVFPLPYNMHTDRSQAEPKHSFYIPPDVSRPHYNSQKQKRKNFANKMKYLSQVKENKDAVSPAHLEQADEYKGAAYMSESTLANFSPKITISSSNSYGSQGEVGEGEKTTDEFLEQTFGTGLELLHARQKLQKLDFYFNFLGIIHEDCRQRMLCEVLKEPSRFYPLSGVLDDATSFHGNFQSLSSNVVNTTEGARLLSYLEAASRAQAKSQSCAVYSYRCPFPTEDMINYDSLCLWSEMVHWLTIHVVARKSTWNLQPLPSRLFTPWA